MENRMQSCFSTFWTPTSSIFVKLGDNAPCGSSREHTKVEIWMIDKFVMCQSRVRPCVVVKKDKILLDYLTKPYYITKQIVFVMSLPECP